MSKLIDEKLRKWLISGENQCDLKKLSAFERAVPKEDLSRSVRLRLLRKHIDQNNKKYFWKLCDANEAVNKNLIDLDDWYHVMKNLTKILKETKTFPDWFKQIQKAIWDSFEFENGENICEQEFSLIMTLWNIEKEISLKEYNRITNLKEIPMNFKLFIDFFQKFILNEIEN